MSKSSSGTNRQPSAPKTRDKSEEAHGTTTSKCEGAEKITLHRKKRAVTAVPSRQNVGPDGNIQDDFY